MAGITSPPPMAMEQPNEYLTLKEVARLFRCTERTVRKFVREQGLQCMQIGNKYLFDPNDVRGWARRHSLPMSKIEEGA